jgi:RHS repeat-associated protein
MPTTKYIWDIQSDNVLAETDENDVTTAVYNNEPDQFGSLISQRRGSITSTYHFDALGSTRELTDSTETVTDTYVYTAFGESVATSGTTINPFRYIGSLGYHFDSEIGDYYVRIRNYSPVIAHWSSRDFAGFLDGPNQYLYVHNNPATYNDPSGLQKKTKEDYLKFCKAWVANEKKNLDWLDDLPDCPCTLDCKVCLKQWTKPVKVTTHPSADVCIRSKPKPTPTNPCPPGQQCCYLVGLLITEPPDAGTPDKSSPVNCRLRHYIDDVNYWSICRLAGRLDLYLEARPPNKGGCEPFASG